MKTLRFSILFVLCCYGGVLAQVGINTTSPEAVLDIRSSNQATPANTDGILIPKIDEFPAINPTLARDGMMVFATGNGTPNKGFYYWDNTLSDWVSVIGAKRINDLIDGKSDNDGTDDGSSIFLGIDAGLNDDGTNNRNVGIGINTMINTTNGHDNVAIGAQVLEFNLNGHNNSGVGRNALNANTSGIQNNAFGAGSLYSNISGRDNNAFGNASLSNNTTGIDNTGLGTLALYRNQTGSYNTAVGNRSGANVLGDRNTFLGMGAGSGISTHLKSGSVHIGYLSGASETNDNRLYIENSNSTAPLIYGEFDNDILRTNGEFQIGSPSGTGYAFPISDGMANQVLQTDGNGSLTWVANTATGINRINDLIDGKSDNDGTDNGSSIFLGIGAGTNDDESDNENIGIGYQALFSNLSGNGNAALGYRALFSNVSGIGNIGIGRYTLENNTIGTANYAIGSGALQGNIDGNGNIAFGSASLITKTTGDSNIGIGVVALRFNTDGSENIGIGTNSLEDNVSGSNNVALGSYALNENLGSGNVAFGHRSGYNETSSNKLYIENTDADQDNALIYGDFGTDNTSTGNVLRTNSEFQIGNPALTGYAFPTTDGTASQVLQTDGSGALNWVDNTTIGVQRINDLIDGSTDSSGSSIFLGINAGLNDDDTNNLNIGIGFNSLTANVSGVNNTAIGPGSMQDNSTGSNNVSIGTFALSNNTAGSANTSIGSFSLSLNTIGIANTALGSNAQRGLNGGSFNTSVGQGSLYNNVSGIRNIAIGYQAGYNETGNDKLYIESSSSATPLIYGEFDNDILGFNGSVAIGHQAPNAKLHVLEEGTSGVQTIVGILESNTSNRPTLLFSEATNPDINDGMSIEYNGTGSGSANRMVLNAIGGAPLFEFRNGGSLTLTQGDLILANDGASDREIIFQDNAGNNDRVLIRQNASDDIYFGDLDDNNGNVILRAGGTDEMIIEDGGQVGINTMTPNYDLEVNGDAAKPGGGTWIASSDRRLKQNISSYQRGLKDILKIKPVTFNYNSKAGFDEHKTHVGVIAQDLQQHIPEMVLTTDSSEAYLAVDNSAMTYMLINAIKEQQIQIEQLKEELKHIKSLIKTD